ncbi:MAG TPA: MMPL family transporter [Microbacteriaceae bacterium]|nr:MMPL family transporter [Microbacteriaceae bacterium]
MRFQPVFIRRWSAWLIAVLGIAISVGVLVGVPKADSADTSALAGLPVGADSTKVVELQQTLPGSDVLPALVVVSKADGSVFAPMEIGVGQKAAADLATFAKSGSEVSPAIPSESGKTLLVTVPLQATNDAVELGEEVDAIQKSVEESFGSTDVTVQITGAAGFTADIAKAFEGADFTLLGATALIVAILLLITYRSPILWLVPIVVVGIADQVAGVAATHVTYLLGVPIDASTTGILSVLVFGAGTDYALLLISRYRDELRIEANRVTAMRRAWRGTFEAITGSALTVAVALVILMLSVFPVTRGLGLACAVGVLVAWVYAMFLLPCALVIFGRGIFWPLIPRVGDALTADRAGLWKRVGLITKARPIAMLLVSFVVIGGLALGNVGLKVGLPTEESFRGNPPSVVAADRLSEEYGNGLTQPAYVIAPANTVDEVTEALEATGLTTAITESNTNGSIVQLDVQMSVDPSSTEAYDAITELRAAVAGIGDVYIGGTVATELDRNDGYARDLALIVPLILLFVFLVLLVLLRSPVAGILLVVSVVATYGGALGAAWLIFNQVLGFSGLADTVPLFTFLFLVALGVDYNIFLATRAAEDSVERGPSEGMLRALAATGGVITSAGILLAAVFAVLGVLPVITLTQIGVVVGIGVLIDTLLVRTILVPALAFWLKEKFWWPRRFSATPSAEGAEPVEARVN